MTLHEVTEHGTRLSVFLIPVWTFGRGYRATCMTCGRQTEIGRKEAVAMSRR